MNSNMICIYLTYMKTEKIKSLLAFIIKYLKIYLFANKLKSKKKNQHGNKIKHLCIFLLMFHVYSTENVNLLK